MGVLLGMYHLLLEKEKMHNFNRFYLLGAVVISLILPFIQLPVNISFVTPQPADAAFIPVMLPSLPVHLAADVKTTDFLPYVVSAVYGLVVMVLAIRFVINILHFYNIRKQGKGVSYQGAAMVLFKEDIQPHTFLGTIYISEKEYRERHSTPELLAHEMVHIRQKHSLDILFIELVKIILWFNPLVYLYKKAIQTNHEFLADENVLRSHNDVPAYQQLLLEKALPCSLHPLASNINFNLTKKRFIMMTKTTSKRRAAMLQFAVVPVSAALMLLSCSTAEITESQHAGSAVVTTDASPLNRVDVMTVTEKEKKELLVTQPEVFDDPSADYRKIKVTENKKDGTTAVKISYAKANEPKYVNHPANINPDDLLAININALTETQMDSLQKAQPEKYPEHNPLNYSMMVYKLKNGETIKEVFQREPLTAK